MPSRVIELLRATEVCRNDREFFRTADPVVYISYHVPRTWVLRTRTSKIEFRAPGYTKQELAKALEDAKAWAAREFGINQWARSPFRSYGDLEFVRSRSAELYALAKKRLHGT